MARVFILRDEVRVHAPLERCFLLSTSVEIVEQELKMTPVRGRTRGLVVGSDTIRWEGWKFGLPQFHESWIDEFRPYTFFRDRMIAGRFAQFEHNHTFRAAEDESVMMRDELRFVMRWGWIGDLIGRWVIAPHIRALLKRRFARLKRIAEGEEWRQYLRAASEEVKP